MRFQYEINRQVNTKEEVRRVSFSLGRETTYPDGEGRIVLSADFDGGSHTICAITEEDGLLLYDLPKEFLKQVGLPVETILENGPIVRKIQVSSY